jgi:hypothetical protein
MRNWMAKVTSTSARSALLHEASHKSLNLISMLPIVPSPSIPHCVQCSQLQRYGATPGWRIGSLPPRRSQRDLHDPSCWIKYPRQERMVLETSQTIVQFEASGPTVEEKTQQNDVAPPLR